MKLDQETVQWQFSVFEWLFREFGGVEELLKTEVILPTPEYFPSSDVSDVFDKVRHYARLEEWPCRLETYDELDPLNDITARMPKSDSSSGGTAGHITTEDKEVIIRYNSSQLNNPMSLVATFSHELAHYLMAAAQTEPPAGWDNHEYTTDLTAVYLGFGVFLANSSIQFSQWQDNEMQGWGISGQGYLSELELSYGLAIFCLLKGCEIKPVLKHLKPDIRSQMKKATKHIQRKYNVELEQLKNSSAR